MTQPEVLDGWVVIALELPLPTPAEFINIMIVRARCAS
jgi:hypothetical protein